MYISFSVVIKMVTEEQKKTIREKIALAEEAIRKAEKDIADLRRAGLTEAADTNQKKLDETKKKLAQLRAVYG